MNCLIIFAILFQLTFSSISPVLVDPEELISFSRLIKNRGYVLKSYKITSEDGYITTLYRILPPNVNETTYSQTRKPIILFHGIQSSGNAFFINSPILTPVDGANCPDDIGFCLLQSGRYDVWSMNARGTAVSQGRAQLSLKPYWNYSYQQMAQYDLPGTIAFVLSATKRKTVGYIGFSQGTSSMFALLSLKPEYANIVQPFIAWAPVTFISHATWPITKTFCPVYKLYRAIGGPYLFAEKWATAIMQLVCRPIPIVEDVCVDAYMAQFGTSVRMNKSRISVYLHFSPDQVSNWAFVHYCEKYENGRYSQFDYGTKQANKEVYGQETAPDFPLSNISPNATIVLVRSTTDIISNPTDAQTLLTALQPTSATVIDHVVAATPFSHVDFTTGMGSGKLVNDPTLAYLDQYTQA